MRPRITVPVAHPTHSQTLRPVAFVVRPIGLRRILRVAVQVPVDGPGACQGAGMADLERYRLTLTRAGRVVKRGWRPELLCAERTALPETRHEAESGRCSSPAGGAVMR